jgi:ABC-type branched-subunit amino acid transport system permease subunit
MTEIFGVPVVVILGQLMLGLVNGAFYAMLSLGLAVIFGLMGVVNFAHGAFYALGSFAALLGLQLLGINYWAGLVLAPLRRAARHGDRAPACCATCIALDPLYGLLLTFGVALIVEGTLQQLFGSSGQSYPVPAALAGAVNLGFMILPKYRAWVIAASITVCFSTWFLIERTRLGATLARGARERAAAAGIRRQRAAAADLDLRRRRGARGARRRARRAGDPGHTANGQLAGHGRVRGGGHRRHGVDPRRDRQRTRRSGSSRASPRSSTRKPPTSSCS